MAKKNKQKKQARKEQQIGAYLAAHPQAALQALRQDPLLATASIRTMLQLDAAARAPERETSPFPVLGPFGGISSTQPLQQTLPKPTPANIRYFTEIPPVRRAIRAIIDPILDLPWAIELRKKTGNRAHETEIDPTALEQRQIEDITAMFNAPNNDMSWRTFLSLVLEDLLTFGAGPFEKQRNRSDERPFFLWPVDAQSIRINAGWQEGSENFRYSQGRGMYYGSLGTPDLIKLHDSELCYMKLNPRASTPFGLGFVEVAFGAVNAFIGGFDYAERRASNNTPNFGIFLGENTTIEQARQYQHYWMNEIEGMGKTPILGGGKQPSIFSMQGSGEDQLYLKWQEHCIRIIAMSFGISPMKLALERDINRSTAEAGQDSDWMSVAPVANVIKDYFTFWLLWKQMRITNMEFVWKMKTADELKQATILAEQYNMNAIKVDEIRMIYERSPLDDGLGDMTKTAYEASIAAALAPEPAPEYDENGAPIRKTEPKNVTPFAKEAEANILAPQEHAFLERLMRDSRRARYGFAEVAT